MKVTQVTLGTSIMKSSLRVVMVEEEQRMERNENVMLRWMCGVTLRDKVPTGELKAETGN